ncbi:MAG: NAD(P)/FAD-dependent oxidoreductase [Myxococcota bacterium]
MATFVKDSSSERSRPRVVILGAGFAGLYTAKGLSGADVDVYLVDKENHHTFQPLLYQVATAGLEPAQVAQPIRGVLRRQENARVLMAEALDIRREDKTVVLDTGELEYDYLVVATGAVPKYFGPDAWRDNSTPLKTVEDALVLRRKILTAFETAEQAQDPDVVQEWLTFVIIGAGPTGVEMAGAIREIAAEVMKRDFRTIDPEEARVVLIDAMPHVLNSYPEELCERAEQDLRDLGVELILDTPVDDIREDAVDVGDETIPCRTVIWSAGVEPSDVLAALDTEYDDQGRAIIGPELTLPDDDSVYVLGDAAHFDHNTDEPLPGLAPVAIQQGKQAAENIQRRVEGEPAERFEYWDRGQMSTIGRAKAVALVGDWHFGGFVAWLAWLFVHLIFLVGFKTKIMVLIEWVYSYLMFRRGARLIIGESERERPAEDIIFHDADADADRVVEEPEKAAV